MVDIIVGACRDPGMQSFPGEQAKVPVCMGDYVEKDTWTAACAVSSHVLGHLSSKAEEPSNRDVEL